jgi:hypothetical protein
LDFGIIFLRFSASGFTQSFDRFSSHPFPLARVTFASLITHTGKFHCSDSGLGRQDQNVSLIPGRVFLNAFLLSQ